MKRFPKFLAVVIAGSLGGLAGCASTTPDEDMESESEGESLNDISDVANPEAVAEQKDDRATESLNDASDVEDPEALAEQSGTDRLDLDPTDAQQLQEQIDAQLVLAPAGVLISQNEIAWNDGEVVMTFPMEGMSGARTSFPAAPPAAVKGCPSNRFCFYRHRNYKGRMLKFRDCKRQSLADYGFGNETSSWVNNTSYRKVDVYDAGPSPDKRLWRETAHSKSSWVGSSANDKADYFKCRK